MENAPFKINMNIEALEALSTADLYALYKYAEEAMELFKEGKAPTASFDYWQNIHYVAVNQIHKKVQEIFPREF